MPEKCKGFVLQNDNSYWNILHTANSHYLSITKKYTQLLSKCREDGVAFDDLRAFLTNEAKRAGIYQKDYIGSDGKPTYKPKSTLKKERPAWFHQLNLFMGWVARNYDTYDVPKEKPEGKKKKSQETVVPDPEPSKVSVVERKDKETGDTFKTVSVTTGKDITEPVERILTPEQVLAIITNNWEVLEKLCRDKGAEKEFQALMEKLAK